MGINLFELNSTVETLQTLLAHLFNTIYRHAMGIKRSGTVMIKVQVADDKKNVG